jgi:hypothetical protein
MSAPSRTERLTRTFRHVDPLRDLTIEAPEGSVPAVSIRRRPFRAVYHNDVQRSLTGREFQP